MSEKPGRHWRPDGPFLRKHWQRKPLLVRGALPECADLVRRDELFELATRDELESRLVFRHGRRWRVQHGPFRRGDLARLPRAGWTLLVQGVDGALDSVRPLLQRFASIPYARLDDLMVSYAPPGGGVGPHFDEYDVFLLQGEGARRWRISRQRDLALVPGAPLRLLRRFRPTREWTLAPGDLLYLPPRCAHDGIAARGDCITYSIGFRAPRAQELGARFLDYLQDGLRLSGAFADPGREPARHPALLGNDLVGYARDALQRIRWANQDVVRFLGRDLTEPKACVVFSRPARALPERAFAAACKRHGIRLAPATRMLYRGGDFFINGETVAVAARPGRTLSRLADHRSLTPRAVLDRETAGILYAWYRAGYIVLNQT